MVNFLCIGFLFFFFFFNLTLANEDNTLSAGALHNSDHRRLVQIKNTTKLVTEGKTK